MNLKSKTTVAAELMYELDSLYVSTISIQPTTTPR
jgi:hypothetical protein